VKLLEQRKLVKLNKQSICIDFSPSLNF